MYNPIETRLPFPKENRFIFISFLTSDLDMSPAFVNLKYVS